jgi:hypothetical protein
MQIKPKPQNAAPETPTLNDSQRRRRIKQKKNNAKLIIIKKKKKKRKGEKLHYSSRWVLNI